MAAANCPSTQSHILNHLRTHIGSVVANSALVEAVWPDDNEPECADKAVRTAVFFLRKRGFPIQTVWGRGYMFPVQP